MGFVTNDPKKGDEQLPGGFGLTVDLELIACPSCGRELPEWQRQCPQCGVDGVPRTSVAARTPDIPAHLLGDEEDEAGTASDEEE